MLFWFIYTSKQVADFFSVGKVPLFCCLIHTCMCVLCVCVCVYMCVCVSVTTRCSQTIHSHLHRTLPEECFHLPQESVICDMLIIWLSGNNTVWLVIPMPLASRENSTMAYVLINAFVSNFFMQFCGCIYLSLFPMQCWISWVKKDPTSAGVVEGRAPTQYEDQ